MFSITERAYSEQAVIRFCFTHCGKSLFAENPARDFLAGLLTILTKFEKHV